MTGGVSTQTQAGLSTQLAAGDGVLDVPTQTSTKSDAELYHAAPMPDLSNITDLDIRTHEMLAAQAPARSTVVDTNTKLPTVTAPQSTPSQPNGGGGDLDAPQQTPAQTSVDPELSNIIEAAKAGVEGRRPNLPQQPTAPLDPETARLNEIATAAVQGRKPNLPVESPTTPAVDESSETGYNGGDTIGVQAEEQPLSDKELYDQYSAVLQELAPSSFEEFQHIRNTEQWNQLEEQYKTLSMYKIDSGSMSAKEIWKLDQKTYKEKTEKFADHFKWHGNIAGAYLDGNFNNMYFAHSQIDNISDSEDYYFGFGQTVLLKSDRRFHYVDVQKANGGIRTDTFYDTEAKLFEYFADLYKQKPFTSITMLSERGMCDSCKGVMEQFKKQFPDVTINVVSNKTVIGNVWGWRRRK